MQFAAPRRLLSLALFGLSVAALAMSRADSPEGKTQGTERPYGLQERVPWTTSRIKGTPEPPAPYRTEPAFPRLKFEEPLAMAHAPGSDRVFVAQRYGKVYSFPNDPRADKAELVFDLKQQILGLTFHPRFEENGTVFLAYILEPSKDQPPAKDRPRKMRVSRFRLAHGDPPRCDPATERVVIEWPSLYHDGGCLAFGKDGCLYISAGDGGGDDNGQGLGDLSSSILRIDVDHPEEGKPYAIPRDNPFVGLAGARSEVWAYGLRQPWRFSIDRATGDLWAGDVGQDLYEMVHLVRRGGNYGWNVREGSHPYQAGRKMGPTPVLPPIVEHSHAEARSITGGYVYRGTRLKELTGAYIYGDYDTGKIWALRYDGRKVVGPREIADSNLRPAAFGEDASGELYLVDHMGGAIHRLAPTPPSEGPPSFPRKLSETGLFASTRDLRPEPGLIPYDVNAPQWADGARMERYAAIPGDSKVEFDAIFFPDSSTGRGPHGWKFPDGTVLVQTFSLELEEGNPATRVRLETRLLHHERLVGTEEVGDQYWRGYTYLWNVEQTDAILLDSPGGLDRTYSILDRDAPGGARQQTWHFPGRTECTLCHTMPAKFALGVNTLQMNRDHDYGGVVDNQLRAWEHIGLFRKPLPAPPEKLPGLVDFSDSKQDLNRRARSYLHANCSHCHRAFGGGNANFQLLANLDLTETGILGARPGQGTFGIADAMIVAPGEPDRSVLYYRMASSGGARMPRVGSRVVDEKALDLFAEWIARMPNPEESAASKSGREETAALIMELQDGADAAQASRADAIRRLTATTSRAVALARALGRGAFPAPVRVEIIEAAKDHPATEVRDLFERFVPEAGRIRRLGDHIDPKVILDLEGDAGRGRAIFAAESVVNCKSCHRLDGVGVELGPDLSKIGAKYPRPELLVHLLEPSRSMDPKYTLYTLATSSGRVHSGLLAGRNEQEIVLRDAENRTIRVAASDVEELAPQKQSLMPDLLLRGLTARQAADLLEYLTSLK